MHGDGHPFPRHIEQLVAKLRVCGQPGKAHAFARVVDTVAIGGHEVLTCCLVQAGARSVSRPPTPGSEPLPLLLQLTQRIPVSLFATRLMNDVLCPSTNGAIVRSGDDRAAL